MPEIAIIDKKKATNLNEFKWHLLMQRKSISWKKVGRQKKDADSLIK